MNNADMPAMPVDYMQDDPECDAYDGFVPVGLTKREHFAAMAMQGLLSNDACFKYRLKGEDVCALIAKAGVDYADALLAELEKRHEP